MPQTEWGTGPGGAGPSARVSTRSWLVLSLAVLGLAGLLALLIGLSRAAALGGVVSPSYFRAALVVHVDLLLVVWYLVMPVLLWRQLGLLGGAGEKASYGLMAAGVLALVIPGVAGAGEPVLANYVPFLIHPLFLAGLAVFLLGVALAAGLAARGLGSGRPALARAGAAGALCVLGALLGMVVAAARASWAGPGWDWEAALVAVFWVGGHLLQFAHTALTMAVWGLLLGGLEPSPARLRRFLGLVWLYPVGVAVGLAGAATLEPSSWTEAAFFTALKSWGLGVPSVLALPLALRMWFETGRGATGRPEARPGRAAVGAGLIVLAVGGGVALLGDLGRQTTLIPGHYHAALTAVALAFMGLTYAVLGGEGVRLPRPRWAAVQPYLYGLGTAALVAGMAWAGLQSAPRKTPGAGWVTDPGTMWALYLWGIGTLLSVAGGAAYLWNVGGAVLRWAGPGRPPSTRAGRPGRTGAAGAERPPAGSS